MGDGNGSQVKRRKVWFEWEMPLVNSFLSIKNIFFLLILRIKLYLLNKKSVF